MEQMMIGRSSFVVAAALTFTAIWGSHLAGQAPSRRTDAAPTAATFHKDVEPIIQKNCQQCHRPGQIGPMSLLNYAEVRPWARGVRDKVLKREMPPWFAEPGIGTFANDRSLSPGEVETIVEWVNAGAPEGDVKDAPPPVAWPAEGWAIAPDVVVKPVPYHVAKSGTLDWVYVTQKLPFTQDTWVSSMEMRPGANARLLHHYCVFVVPRRDGTQYGEFSTGTQGQATAGAPFEGCYEKGQEAFDYRKYGAAHLIPANSDIIFQLHYVPTGAEADDQPQIGFTVTQERPKKQFAFVNTGAGQRISIQPYERNYVAPQQEAMLTQDAEIVWLQAHAHYRAKSFGFEMTRPGAVAEPILKVRWDPNWQGLYYPVQPLVAPKGTMLTMSGVYDNSAANKFNPDPSLPVKFGEQAKDEMMFITWGLLVDGSIDTKQVRLAQPSGRADRSFTVNTQNSSAAPASR